MPTTPGTPPRPQKRKRLPKYGREWEDAHAWLDSVNGDVYKASCKICRRVFSVAHGGLSDIRQHATGEQHCRHERSQKTQASVSQFFIPQSSPEVDTDVLQEELLARLQSRLQQALSRQPLDLDFLEFVCCNKFVLFQSFADQIHIDNDILQQLNYLLELVHAAIVNSTTESHFDTAVGLKGKPRMIIQKDQLQHLLDSQFSVPCIAQL
ncbi:unnamed protein product [Gadus morhua 'NCC']